MFVTARKRSLGKVMFLHLSQSFSSQGGLCPSMHHSSRDQGGYLSRGVSVQGSLSREVSVCGGGGSLCQGGVSVREPFPRERPLYGNERAVRILLECILVYQYSLILTSLAYNEHFFVS